MRPQAYNLRVKPGAGSCRACAVQGRRLLRKVEISGVLSGPAAQAAPPPSTLAAHRATTHTRCCSVRSTQHRQPASYAAMGLLPMRFESVGDLSTAGADGILSTTVLENAVGSAAASIVAPGLAPAGGHSLGMGAWGATEGAVPAEPHHQAMAEWCAVTAGSVTTVDPTGVENTFTAGDVFVVPKGIDYVWKQSEDMKKFYGACAHRAAQCSLWRSSALAASARAGSDIQA